MNSIFDKNRKIKRYGMKKEAGKGLRLLCSNQLEVLDHYLLQFLSTKLSRNKSFNTSNSI